MQAYTTNLKKRAPLWVWAILLTVILIIVVCLVLHLTGFVDLGFLGLIYLEAHMWSSTEVINALIQDGLVAVLGASIFYFFYRYVFGVRTQAQMPIATANNIQTGLTVQPPIQQKEVVTIEEAK